MTVEEATPVDAEILARKPNTRFWDVLIGVSLGLLLVSTIMTAIAVLRGLDDDATFTNADLWFGNAFNLVLMGLIPLAWVVGTRVGGWRAVVPYLRLDRPLVGAMWGAIATFGMWAFMIVFVLVLELAGFAEDNPALDEIGSTITWPLIIVTALVAAFAEEILFRGVLQRWVGWWGQAILFGIVHIGYGTILQVVVPLLLGLVYGYMIHRGLPLWSAIVSHFIWNFVALSIAAGHLDVARLT